MISYVSYLPHPPILIPAIGQNDERVLRSFTAQVHIAQDIKALEKKTDLVVIMSPHAPADRKHIPIYTAETYMGDFGEFNHSELAFSFAGAPGFARALVTSVSSLIPLAAYDAGPLDHGVLVPLYSLQQLGYTKPICVLGMSYEAEEHYRFGVALAAFARETQKNIVFIGSGDMSHALKDSGPYAYNPAGPSYDAQVVEAIRAGKEEQLLDFSPTFLNAAAECGYRSLLTIAGIRSECPELKPEVIAYECPFGVGYMTARWRKR